MKPLKMDEFRQSMELGNVNTTLSQSTRTQKKKRASVTKGNMAAAAAGGGREPDATEAATVTYDVLIVDDSGTNRKMLRRMMTSAGHECDEAEDGLQAIMKAKQKIEQSGLSKRSYDVVLMDYVMPNMDGPTTTKALRAMGYEGVVIGITGNNVDFDHFLNCGANRVIEKPLKIEVFVDAMDTFDKKKRQAAAQVRYGRETLDVPGCTLRPSHPGTPTNPLLPLAAIQRAGIAEDDGSGPGSMVATSRHAPCARVCSRSSVPPTSPPVLALPRPTGSPNGANPAPAAAQRTSPTSSTLTIRPSSSSRSRPCSQRCCSR